MHSEMKESIFGAVFFIFLTINPVHIQVQVAPLVHTPVKHHGVFTFYRFFFAVICGCEAVMVKVRHRPIISDDFHCL